MDEIDFKVWLTLYLQGISVSEAMSKFPTLARPDAEMPSAKTITNLFRRIGRYLFHKGFEPYLWSMDYKVPAEHLEKGVDSYQRHLDDVAANVIKHAKEAISLEQYHVLVQSERVGKITDRIALEVRALLVARKGVSDPRADVGLAFLRAFTPGSLPRNKMRADHILDMAENTLQDMLNDPMDEDGNTHSYLRSEPGKIHHNNNGAFDKKYWATRGIWIDEWKKKQWHKNEKRRLGYIRTSATEQNLQEQRDALLAVSCCKIFEDINVSAEDQNWPGLDALLAEAFEYDTIVVLTLDRLGGSAEQWAEVMTIIYDGGLELCAINDDFDTSKRILS